MTGRGFPNAHTYANLHSLFLFMVIKRVCLSVYVSCSMTGRGFSNIHTCSAHIFIFWNRQFWACMFERVCLTFNDRQRGFKHTYMLICRCWFCLSMYVWDIHTCLDTSDIHTCSQVSDIHTRLAISNIHACLGASNIHTCIHANFAHRGAGSDSSRKTFSIWSPVQFFEICEGGGTSGGLRHTYMLKQNQPCM